MAVIKKGILGGFKGKSGTVVGYELNGQSIIRGLPQERSTKPTEKELINREKFKVSQIWLKPLVDFLRVGFQGYQPTYQGFVAAKSYNYKHALKTDDGENFYMDPSQVLVSYGTLEQVENPTMELSSNELTISWGKGGNFQYDDKMMVMAYCIEKETVVFNTTIALQQKKKAVLEMPPRIFDMDFHVYLAVVSEDRKNRSNSQYLGKISVPASKKSLATVL